MMNWCSDMQAPCPAKHLDIAGGAMYFILSLTTDVRTQIKESVE